jgi:hypothetical protein
MCSFTQCACAVLRYVAYLVIQYFLHYITNGTILRTKKLLNIRCVFCCLIIVGVRWRNYSMSLSDARNFDVIPMCL